MSTKAAKKSAPKKSASKKAKTTEEVAKSPEVTSTPVVEAQAAGSVATANHLEAIRSEAKDLEGAERRTSFGSVEEPQKPKKEDYATEITVQYRDHEGKVVDRTYSHAVHGPDFKVLADEFKKVNASRIVT